MLLGKRTEQLGTYSNYRIIYLQKEDKFTLRQHK